MVVRSYMWEVIAATVMDVKKVLRTWADTCCIGVMVLLSCCSSWLVVVCLKNLVGQSRWIRVNRFVSLFGFVCRRRRFGQGLFGGVSWLSGGSVVVLISIVGDASVGGGVVSHVVVFCRSRNRLGGQNRLGGEDGGGIVSFSVVTFSEVLFCSSSGGPNGTGMLNCTCGSGGFAYPSFLSG